MTIESTITSLLSEQHTLSRQQRQATITRIAEFIREKGAGQRSITQPPGILLSDIETQPVQWLWHQRLPLGALSLLEGEAGIGTSLLALAIAASVSRGNPMPDDTPTQQQGKVILIAPPSSPAAILKPRLEAAGGDSSQVLLLNTVESLDAQHITLYDRPFTLPDHLPLLEESITRLKPLLVIIDPLALVLHCGQSSIHETLFQLAALSNRTGCAILLIRHIKPHHAATSLIQDAGFPGLTASVPTILRLIRHPDDEQQRLLVSIKHTFSSAPATLNFQLTASPAAIPTLHCLGETHHPTQSLPNLSNLSTQRQTILRLLGESLHPLTPTEIAHHTNLTYDAVRLLLGRMLEAHEIAHPARGYYTAHQHHSLDTPTHPSPPTIDTTETINDHPPAAPNTTNTTDDSPRATTDTIETTDPDHATNPYPTP
ncbi:MAG TPA: AAA family ATPase [Ktedonobacteraceae bacterium]|nr:AAA family ATPase [Ktedonobacteraceae bacterium]